MRGGLGGLPERRRAAASGHAGGRASGCGDADSPLSLDALQLYYSAQRLRYASFRGDAVAYWWVNHKQTRDHEVRGGYLWSPKRNANGARNTSYENMTRAMPGDIVFSYAHGRIGAIGRVTSLAYSSPKPAEFGSVGDYWSNEGWLLDVDFVQAPKPLRPRDHISAIGPLLPTRHSPIQSNGNGNQGIYLAAISDALGMVLMALLQAQEVRDLSAPAEYVVERMPDATILEDIQRIESDQTVIETQRIQLTKARVGQGLFRKRVPIPRTRSNVSSSASTKSPTVWKPPALSAWIFCSLKP